MPERDDNNSKVFRALTEREFEDIKEQFSRIEAKLDSLPCSKMGERVATIEERSKRNASFFGLVAGAIASFVFRMFWPK